MCEVGLLACRITVKLSFFVFDKIVSGQMMETSLLSKKIFDHPNKFISKTVEIYKI